MGLRHMMGVMSALSVVVNVLMASLSDSRECRIAAPVTANQTHYLGPFGQRADIALPSSSRPVAGFFIQAADNQFQMPRSYRV